jgi:hypothetical protein
MARPTAADYWHDSDTPAVCLVALLIDGHGTEAFEWAPRTIRDEIAHENNGTEIAPRNLDRLMAMIVAMTRPHEFYTSAAGFHSLSQAIAGTWFEPHVAHEPVLEDVLWAVIETHICDAPDDKEERFSPEVIRYVNMIARNEGYRRLPPIVTAYGIPKDPSVWNQIEANDYSSDEDLGPAVTAAADDREKDLSLDIVDRVHDLAQRMRTLPFRHKGPERAARILLNSTGRR